MSRRTGGESGFTQTICNMSVKEPIENFHVKQWEGVTETETLSMMHPEMDTAAFSDGPLALSSRTNDRV